MGRLVDIDEVIKAVDRHTKDESEIVLDNDITCILEEVPTAYSIEKVVAELEKASKTMMPVIPTNHAIYIVKNGSNPELFKYYGVGMGETAVIKKFGIDIEKGGVE